MQPIEKISVLLLYSYFDKISGAIVKKFPLTEVVFPFTLSNYFDNP